MSLETSQQLPPNMLDRARPETPSITLDHIPKLIAGDPETMTWYVGEYGGRCRRYLERKRRLPPDVAQDVATDTLVAVLNRFADTENPFEGNPDAYVFVALCNNCASAKRRLARDARMQMVPLPFVTSPTTGEVDMLEQADPSDRVDEVICLLSTQEQLRAVRDSLGNNDYMTAFDGLIQGLSSDQIGADLGRSEAAGRTLCTRVRQRAQHIYEGMSTD